MEGTEFWKEKKHMYDGRHGLVNGQSSSTWTETIDFLVGFASLQEANPLALEQKQSTI